MTTLLRSACVQGNLCESAVEVSEAERAKVTQFINSTLMMEEVRRQQAPLQQTPSCSTDDAGACTRPALHAPTPSTCQLTCFATLPRDAVLRPSQYLDGDEVDCDLVSAYNSERTLYAALAGGSSSSVPICADLSRLLRRGVQLPCPPASPVRSCTTARPRTAR